MDMHRLTTPREALPVSLQDKITMLETITALQFIHAEDWTNHSRGYVLQFDTYIYKEWRNYGKLVHLLRMMFDTYEDVECTPYGYRVLI